MSHGPPQPMPLRRFAREFHKECNRRGFSIHSVQTHDQEDAHQASEEGEDFPQRWLPEPKRKDLCTKTLLRLRSACIRTKGKLPPVMELDSICFTDEKLFRLGDRKDQYRVYVDDHLHRSDIDPEGLTYECKGFTASVMVGMMCCAGGIPPPYFMDEMRMSIVRYISDHAFPHMQLLLPGMPLKEMVLYQDGASFHVAKGHEGPLWQVSIRGSSGPAEQPRSECV